MSLVQIDVIGLEGDRIPRCLSFVKVCVETQSRDTITVDTRKVQWNEATSKTFFMQSSIVDCQLQIFQQRLLHSNKLLASATLTLGEMRDHSVEVCPRGIKTIRMIGEGLDFGLILRVRFLNASQFSPATVKADIPRNAFLMLDPCENVGFVEIQCRYITEVMALFLSHEVGSLSRVQGENGLIDVWRIHVVSSIGEDKEVNEPHYLECLTRLCHQVCGKLLEKLVLFGFRIVGGMAAGALVKSKGKSLAYSPNVIYMCRTADTTDNKSECPHYMFFDPLYAFDGRSRTQGMVLQGEVVESLQGFLRENMGIPMEIEEEVFSHGDRKLYMQHPLVDDGWEGIRATGEHIKGSYNSAIARVMDCVSNAGYSYVTPYGWRHIYERKVGSHAALDRSSHALVSCRIGEGEITVSGTLQPNDIPLPEIEHSASHRGGNLNIFNYRVSNTSGIINTEAARSAQRIIALIELTRAVRRNGFEFVGNAGIDEFLISKSTVELSYAVSLKLQETAPDVRYIYIQPEIVMTQFVLQVLGPDVDERFIGEMTLMLKQRKPVSIYKDGHGLALFHQFPIDGCGLFQAYRTHGLLYYQMIKTLDWMHSMGWSLDRMIQNGAHDEAGNSGSLDVTDAGILMSYNGKHTLPGNFVLVLLRPEGSHSATLLVTQPSGCLSIPSLVSGSEVPLQAATYEETGLVYQYEHKMAVNLIENEEKSYTNANNRAQNAYVRMLDGVARQGGTYLFSWGQFGAVFFMPDTL